MKSLEWIFIAVHWLGIPVLVAMGIAYHPVSTVTAVVLTVLIALWSAVAGFLNRRIKTIEGQVILGVASQALVAALAWAMIFQFLRGQTAAYGAFAIVIIEGAVRFGLVASLIMEVVFVAGLTAAMLYRVSEYGAEFSWTGYAFWAIFLFFIALSVGLVTEEARRERRRSASLVRERTLLEERGRIARDLHDTVLKTLHGLALEAHALGKRADSPAAKERARYIEGVCQRSSQQIREMIHELRSESQEAGIASEISRTVADWSNATGIKAEFSSSGDDRSLPLLVSHNLRYVLSEALENIRKHAHASQVKVALELQPGEVRLEIADNGHGMPCSPAELNALVSAGKYGMQGMKERVEQINGQFAIDTSQGTRLSISAPLTPPS
ncbi:MAG: sensor histidine kinase [Dehalococcoidia bacterium]|nr:sensor histidine kinase [Dehalococcoidia bacterium]